MSDAVGVSGLLIVYCLLPRYSLGLAVPLFTLTTTHTDVFDTSTGRVVLAWISPAAHTNNLATNNNPSFIQDDSRFTNNGR